MADKLGYNPLVIDLNASTAREIVPVGTKIAIVAIQVDGVPSQAVAPNDTSDIELRQVSATGPHVWQWTVPGNTTNTAVHIFESFSSATGVVCDGLYFDVAHAWVGGVAGAIMLIYYK